MNVFRTGFLESCMQWNAVKRQQIKNNKEADMMEMRLTEDALLVNECTVEKRKRKAWVEADWN